jgi:hypothetical protein
VLCTFRAGVCYCVVPVPGLSVDPSRLLEFLEEYLYDWLVSSGCVIKPVARWESS